MTYFYPLLQIAIMAVCTLLTRALPFMLFPAGKKQPEIFNYFSRALPHAVIGMLVVYCLKDVTLTAFPYGLPELIAILVTAGLHLYKKKVVLSLSVGTALYMLLTHTVFMA